VVQGWANQERGGAVCARRYLPGARSHGPHVRLICPPGMPGTDQGPDLAVVFLKESLLFLGYPKTSSDSL